MKTTMEIKRAVRIAFSFSLKYHFMYGGSICDDSLYRKTHEEVLSGVKINSINSVAGDVFASICHEFGIFGEDYFKMAEEFFVNTLVQTEK
jgi:hypothetical protein